MTLSRSKKAQPSVAVPVSKATDTLKRVTLTVGQQKALEGLEKGHQRAIAEAKLRAARNAERVMKAAFEDLKAGYGARGRAKRIALDLPPDDRTGRRLTERSVLRILDRLSACPIDSAKKEQHSLEVAHAK